MRRHRWIVRAAKLCALVSALALLALPAVARATTAGIVGWGDDQAGEADAHPGDYAAISAGGGPPGGHTLALRSDGTIVGWGYDAYGQADAPAGRDYVAIAAGCYHSLALRSDGTIVAWGYAEGYEGMPSGGRYTAISGGGFYTLALRQDGSIAGWGHYLPAGTPTGTGFAAISAGYDHALALRQDGSIAAWGYWGVTNLPAGTGFTAIAAGANHSLALRRDGSIVGWGADEAGQADPPANARYVAIDAGWDHSVALEGISVDDLLSGLVGAPGSSVTAAGVASAKGLIDDAAAKAAVGNVRAAAGMYGAVERRVDAWLSAGRITQAQHDALIAAIDAQLAGLGR